MTRQGSVGNDVEPERLERLLGLLSETPMTASRAVDLLPPVFGPTAAAASSLQRRLWFLEQLHPANGTYHVPLALRLRGALDVDALRDALARVVARHEILRTSLTAADGTPLQTIHSSVPASLPLLDVDGEAVAGYRASIAAMMTEDFDLAAVPLWRAALLRASADDHCLAFVFHHAVMDGRSRDVFCTELADAYRAVRQGRSEPTASRLQFAEFVAWQHVLDASGLLEDDIDYWTRALRGAPAGLDLGGDGLHATAQSMRGGTVHTQVDDGVVQRLERIIAAADATTFTVGLAAWAAWLRQRTGVGDLVITVPSAGRTLPQFEHLLGPVVNTLALRIDVDRATSFVELARDVRRLSLQAQQHQHAPLERVLDRLRPGRRTVAAPLAQVAFSREPALPRPEFPGLTCEVLHIDHAGVKTDLALALSRVDRRWDLSLEYSADVFSPRAAALALEDFTDFLAELTAAPDGPLPARSRTRAAGAVRIPLTPVQARVWLDQQRSPETPLYNVAVAIDIAGAVDVAAVRRAFARLVAEADALRLSFSFDTGTPYQRVSDRITGSVDEVDLSNQTADERSAWLTREATTPFRMEGPLFRAALVKTAQNAWTWLFVQHHLITDGWSTRLLIERMADLYDEECGSARTDPQFGSFVTHARAHLAVPDYDEWWNDRFSDVDAPRFFGTLPQKWSTEVTRTRVRFEPELLGAFRTTAETAARSSKTQAAFTVCGAALVALLHRMTGRETIAFGMPFHNRRSAQDRDVVGLLMNVLPIAVSCQSTDTFATLFERINVELRATLRRSQSLPPPSVRERACDVLLNVQATTLDELFGHQATIEWVHTGHERESLTLQFHDLSDGRTGFDIQTHDDVFGAEERQQIVDRLMRMVRACAHDPATRIGDVALIDGDASARAMALSAGPAIPEAFAEPAIARILRMARTLPAVTALVAGDETLTYAELDRRIHAIAGAVLARGIVRDDVIAVRLDRGSEFVCAILGVLAAGAAYLPVDMRWPAGRIEQCLTDAAARLTIVPAGEAKSDDEVAIDALLAGPSAAAPARRAPADLAYVIYTSGSTGAPKGVEVVDRGLANYTAYAAVAFELTEGDRVLQFASLAFDTAVEEIFPTLASGATLVLRDEAMIASPDLFVRRLHDLRISVPESADVCTGTCWRARDFPAAFASSLSAARRCAAMPSSSGET